MKKCKKIAILLLILIIECNFLLAQFIEYDFSKISKSSRGVGDNCNCDTMFICINVEDMIPEGNSHYFKTTDGPITVKFISPSFNSLNMAAKFVPRYLEGDSKDFAKLMLVFKLPNALLQRLLDYPYENIPMQLDLILYDNDAEKNTRKPWPFDLKPKEFRLLGNNVQYQQQPIKAAYPELLTILAISADIKDKLSGIDFFYEFDSTTNNQADPMQWRFKEVQRPSNHQDSAYVRAINLLNDREFNRNSSVLLSIDQVEELMELYLYLKSYVEPNSFYNQEAKNLAASIVVMDYTLRNIENDSLRKTLNFSRNVYEKYSSTIDRLNSLFIRTKVVLFHNGILSQSDEKEYFLLQKEPILNSEEEILTHMGSFGAFVIPTRLRLSSPVEFTNDFAIGVSTHFPIFTNPTLDLVAGLGLSAIRTDTIGDQKNLKLAAVTTTAGITIAPFGDHFQIGVFVGLDTGNLLEYQKKPWLAIGAAYRLKKPKIKPARPRE